MDVETTEKTLVTLSRMCTELVEEVDVLRRLVVSMALALPRERIPDDERAVLDNLLDGPE